MEFISPKGYAFSDEVQEALRLLDQGSILSNVPLVYAADGSHAVLERTARALSSTVGGVHLVEIDAMVTSQTCDIRGPGSKNKPFLTVAPVYPARLLSNDSANALRRRAYVVPLSGPEFAAELHVADLRFETTIEKSMVAGRRQIVPFLDRSELFELAKKLGENRRRAAFDVNLENGVLHPLSRLLSPDYAEQIYEIRVDAKPNIARASTARLILACYPEADLDAIGELLNPWYDGLRESLEAPILLPLQIDTIDRLTLIDVQGSVPFYFSDLSDEATEP